MRLSGLKKFIDFRCESSLETRVAGMIDVLFCDSLPELREPEVRHFLPQINPNGLILMHDASSHLKTVREAAKRMEDEGLISVVFLPTPRGLVIAQKRAGRKQGAANYEDEELGINTTSTTCSYPPVIRASTTRWMAYSLFGS